MPFVSGLRRHLFLSLALGVCLLAPLAARAQYASLSGWCETGKVQTLTAAIPSTPPPTGAYVQGSYPGCTVSIYYQGTTNLVPGSDIFSDALGTVLGNPFTASNSTGQWTFFVNQSLSATSGANGIFDVKISGGNLPAPVTLPYTSPSLNPANAVVGQLTATSPAITPTSIEQVRYADQFGTCDGVTDDTTGLQTAINTATAAKAVLVVPPGKVCLATAPLTVTSGANIQGFGRRNGAASGTIKFVLTVPASSTETLIGPPNTTASLSNLTIAGLTLDYTGVTVPSGSTLIAVDAYGGNDSNVQDNLFAGPVSNPSSWSGGTVIGVKVEPSLGASPIVEANYARASDNEFYADTQDIQFSDGGNASYPSNAGVITYNLFLDAAVTGDTGGANIRLNDSVGTLISGDRFSNPGYNVVLSGGGNTMFMGNYWDSNANTVYITNNSGQASYYYGNRNLDIANIVNSGGASTIGIDALGQTPGIDIGSGLNATPSGQPGAVHLRLADDYLAYWDHGGNTASRSWGMGDDIITFGDFGILASATQTGALANLVLYSTPTDAFLCSRIASPASSDCLQIDNTGTMTVPTVDATSVAATTVNATTLEQGGAGVALASQLPLPNSVAGSTSLLAANSCGDTVTLTVTGATTSMTAIASSPAAFPATANGLTVKAAVTSANTVTVGYCNVTGSGITPAAATIQVRVIQ